MSGRLASDFQRSLPPRVEFEAMPDAAYAGHPQFGVAPDVERLVDTEAVAGLP